MLGKTTVQGPNMDTSEHLHLPLGACGELQTVQSKIVPLAAMLLLVTCSAVCGRLVWLHQIACTHQYKLFLAW